MQDGAVLWQLATSCSPLVVCCLCYVTFVEQNTSCTIASDCQALLDIRLDVPKSWKPQKDRKRLPTTSA